MTCSSCSNLYTSPTASAVTDAHRALPDPWTRRPGRTIPLVVQVGKWRKQYTIANVTKCVDNPQPDKSLRLPKNHTEGDIPHIAISTGGADSLECLLLRMGVDASEYVARAGKPAGGHIHIFTGHGGVGGAACRAERRTTPAPTLWDKAADIKPYDIVLLSCEGAETANLNDAGQQVLFDYANDGRTRLRVALPLLVLHPTGPSRRDHPARRDLDAGPRSIDNVPITASS